VEVVVEVDVELELEVDVEDVPSVEVEVSVEVEAEVVKAAEDVSRLVDSKLAGVEVVSSATIDSEEKIVAIDLKDK